MSWFDINEFGEFTCPNCGTAVERRSQVCGKCVQKLTKIDEFMKEVTKDIYWDVF